MKSVVVLYGNLTYDSRAKRAISYLDKFSDVDVIHTGLKSRGETYKNTILFSYKVLVLCFKKKPKFIYAVGLLSLLFSLPARILLNIPIIYDSREIYLKDTHGISTYSWKHRLIERLCVRFVRAIVTANEERLQLMKTHYTSVKDFSFLQNIPNFNNEKNYSIQANSGPKRVVYQGHIGVKRGLDKFIKAASLINPAVEIVFIVPKRDHVALIAMLKSQQLKYSLLDFMPIDKLFDILNSCDLGYVGYELYGLNNTYCEPNKLYEYAYSNLKMITSPQVKFSNIFQNYHIGHCFNKDAWMNDDYKAMAKDIKHALELCPAPEDFRRFKNDFNASKEQARLLEFINTLPI